MPTQHSRPQRQLGGDGDTRCRRWRQLGGGRITEYKFKVKQAMETHRSFLLAASAKGNVHRLFQDSEILICEAYGSNRRFCAQIQEVFTDYHGNVAIAPRELNIPGTYIVHMAARTNWTTTPNGRVVIEEGFKPEKILFAGWQYTSDIVTAFTELTGYDKLDVPIEDSDTETEAMLNERPKPSVLDSMFMRSLGPKHLNLDFVHDQNPERERYVINLALHAIRPIRPGGNSESRSRELDARRRNGPNVHATASGNLLNPPDFSRLTGVSRQNAIKIWNGTDWVMVDDHGVERIWDVGANKHFVKLPDCIMGRTKHGPGIFGKINPPSQQSSKRKPDWKPPSSVSTSTPVLNFSPLSPGASKFLCRGSQQAAAYYLSAGHCANCQSTNHLTIRCPNEPANLSAMQQEKLQFLVARMREFSAKSAPRVQNAKPKHGDHSVRQAQLFGENDTILEHSIVPAVINSPASRCDTAHSTRRKEALDTYATFEELWTGDGRKLHVIAQKPDQELEHERVSPMEVAIIAGTTATSTPRTSQIYDNLQMLLAQKFEEAGRTQGWFAQRSHWLKVWWSDRTVSTLACQPGPQAQNAFTLPEADIARGATSTAVHVLKLPARMQAHEAEP
jgi:hypothetical protein